MSLLQNPFLEVPLKKAIAFYNHEVVPKLTKKNKAIAITAAIAISFVILVREKLMKPPKKLRHIPYISFWSLVKSTLNGESVWDRSYRLLLPKVKSVGGSGIYSVSALSIDIVKKYKLIFNFIYRNLLEMAGL